MNPIRIGLSAQVKRQNGMALVVSLLFLLAMTMAGVTGMQSTALEEKMTGNMRDRNLAFSAAESAVQSAESMLERTRALPDFSDDGNGGFYANTTSTPPDWKTVWSNPDLTASYQNGNLADIANAPRFVVEELQFTTGQVAQGGSLKITPVVPETVRSWYRVTARGTGMTDNAVVILQSIYRR